MEIRDYSEKDYDQINSLWIETGLGGKARGDTKDVIENTLKYGAKLLVLKKAGEIIGTSWMTTDKRRIYLHHFSIKPDYQGKGFSKLLMDESMKFVREQGLQVKLEVHKENFKALNLYKKYGFEYLGDYIVLIVRNVFY